MIKKSKNYIEKSKRLLDAIILGEEIISNSKHIELPRKEAYMKFSENIKNMVINPQKEFENLKSLAYLEDSFLTFWNENCGDYIDKFWKEIADKSIAYQRKDVFREVLNRKKIKNSQEYNSIIDGLVIAQQNGKITTNEVLNINKYISDFERKQLTGK